MTNTNTLTSRSGYTDTTLRAASTKNFNEERRAVTLESNTRAGACVCVLVCVCVRGDRPIKGAREAVLGAGRDLGGVPWARSEED